MVKKKGEKYECSECGLIVVIEDDGCVCEECDVVCCDVPMELVKEKPKKAPAKGAAKKPKAGAKTKTTPATKKKPVKKK